MKYFKKRGLSTLISTILLVSFAIVLGIIITSWSSRLIKSNIEKSEQRIGTDLECLNVNIKISPGANNKVFVENNNLKEQQLAGLISRFTIGNKIFVDYKNQNTIVSPFGATVLDYTTVKDRNGNPDTSYDYNNLEAIEVIPRITLEEKGGVVDCAKKSAKYSF